MDAHAGVAPNQDRERFVASLLLVEVESPEGIDSQETGCIGVAQRSGRLLDEMRSLSALRTE